MGKALYDQEWAGKQGALLAYCPTKQRIQRKKRLLMTADTGKWKANGDWWADERFYPGVIHSCFLFWGLHLTWRPRAALHSCILLLLQAYSNTAWPESGAHSHPLLISQGERQCPSPAFQVGREQAASSRDAQHHLNCIWVKSLQEAGVQLHTPLSVF